MVRRARRGSRGPLLVPGGMRMNPFAIMACTSGPFVYCQSMCWSYIGASFRMGVGLKQCSGITETLLDHGEVSDRGGDVHTIGTP
jgi:hypothetical protein